MNLFFTRITLTLFLFITLFSCTKAKKDDTPNTAALTLVINNASKTTAVTTTTSVPSTTIPATLPSSLTFTGNALSAISGNFIVTFGNALTITNTSTTLVGATAIYSVSPSLPSGLTLDTATGNISGTAVNTLILSSYTITATYTAASGYRLGYTGATGIIKIFVGNSTTISNLTCNSTGTGVGCPSTSPYTCLSAILCYSSYANCYNSASCIQ